MTKRRKLLQSALALWPLSGSRAAAAPTGNPGIYGELGIRPLINFQGTMTTIGASKMSADTQRAMAEASRHYVPLAELQQKVGERLAKLCGTESAMVISGAAGAIAVGTYGCLTGEDTEKVRRLPDLTGMKSTVIIQKSHRNGYDHAVRSAGVRVVTVETREELGQALRQDAAMMYYLGGTSHDWTWETPIPLQECLAACRAAGVPLMVDAANMLPPWGNIPKLAGLGVDLIAVSGGKHMRGPQSAGILAGRKDLLRAAALNANPYSDSQGRPMKVGREEMAGLLVAAEYYAKLDFEAIDREKAKEADYLIGEFRKLGLKAEKTPFDRTRRVHRVLVSWDRAKWSLSPAELERKLLEGDPRIAIGRSGDSVEFTVFMNDAGDEKLAAARMKEIFRA